MIRIVTDSTVDLDRSLIEAANLEIVPLNVIFGDRAYAEGIDITATQFYEMMAESKDLPTTSQPSPALMKERFQRILDAGDDVYYIGLSSTLSGTVQSAKIGRDMVSDPERVTIFDTLSVTFGQGLLALEAAKMAKEGKTAPEITAHLKELRERQMIVFSVDNLNNLRKSGRINNLSFLFGSLLSIKPIMMLDTKGVVQVYEKARGKKNAYQSLFRFLEEYKPDSDYAIGVGHSYAPERAAELIQDMKAAGYTNITPFEIGGVIGTHVGAGTLGIVVISKK